MIDLIITHLVQEVLPLYSQQVEIANCSQACPDLTPPSQETCIHASHGHDSQFSSWEVQASHGSADVQPNQQCDRGPGCPHPPSSEAWQAPCKDDEDDAPYWKGSLSGTLKHAVKKVVLHCSPGQAPGKCHHQPHVTHTSSSSTYSFENPGWRRFVQLRDVSRTETSASRGVASKLNSKSCRPGDDLEERRPACKFPWRPHPQRKPAASKPVRHHRKRLPTLIRLHSCMSCLGRYSHADQDVQTLVCKY